MAFMDVNINNMKFVTLAVWFLASGPTLAEGLYQCPGPLFTNQIDPAQAQAQGCVRAGHGRLSVVQAGESASLAAPTARPRVAGLKTASAARPSAPAPEQLRTASASMGGQQRERDQQARAILESELARTRGQLQALSSHGGDAGKQAQLERLRNDEAALQRELARRPG